MGFPDGIGGCHFVDQDRLPEMDIMDPVITWAYRATDVRRSQDPYGEATSRSEFLELRQLLDGISPPLNQTVRLPPRQYQSIVYALTRNSTPIEEQLDLLSNLTCSDMPDTGVPPMGGLVDSRGTFTQVNRMGAGSRLTSLSRLGRIAAPLMAAAVVGSIWKYYKTHADFKESMNDFLDSHIEDVQTLVSQVDGKVDLDDQISQLERSLTERFQNIDRPFLRLIARRILEHKTEHEFVIPIQESSRLATRTVNSDNDDEEYEIIDDPDQIDEETRKRWRRLFEEKMDPYNLLEMRFEWAIGALESLRDKMQNNECNLDDVAEFRRILDTIYQTYQRFRNHYGENPTMHQGLYRYLHFFEWAIEIIEWITKYCPPLYVDDQNGGERLLTDTIREELYALLEEIGRIIPDSFSFPVTQQIRRMLDQLDPTR